jgi:hypothetical protein
MHGEHLERPHLEGSQFVSHRWIWDPIIICRLIQLLLEDKQYSNREDYNVSIFGHYYITECYAYQGSQIGVTASSGDIEGFYWDRLASFIIRIHSVQLGFGSIAFRGFL